MSNRLAQQPPYMHLLILLGLMGVGFAIAGVVQIVILLAAMKEQLGPEELKNLESLMQDFLLAPENIMLTKWSQLFASLLSFVLPAVIFAWIIRNDYLQFRKRPKIGSMVLTVILVFVGLPAIYWSAEWNSAISLPEWLGPVKDFFDNAEESAGALTENFLKMDSVGELIFNLVLIAVIPAFGEEMFFRGGLQNVVQKWTGNVHAAVWITGFIFSFIHLQLSGFIPRMMLGALMGYLFVWSGSLWLPILAHFVNNGTAVVLAYMSGLGVLDESPEAVGGEELAIWMALSSTLLVLGILLIIKKIENRKASSISTPSG